MHWLILFCVCVICGVWSADQIRSRRKTVEGRLCTPSRVSIKAGDRIEFALAAGGGNNGNQLSRTDSKGSALTPLSPPPNTASSNVFSCTVTHVQRYRYLFSSLFDWCAVFSPFCVVFLCVDGLID